MGETKGPNTMSKNNTGRILKDFCESTSLHGYGYIYDDHSIVLKLFWIFVILIMTGLGILLLVTNTVEFLEHKVYTTTETTSAPISVSSTKIYPLYFSQSKQPYRIKSVLLRRENSFL